MIMRLAIALGGVWMLLWISVLITNTDNAQENIEFVLLIIFIPPIALLLLARLLRWVISGK